MGETDLGFKEWADQEMKTHGKKESFDDWLDDELKSHGDDITLQDWGHHELDSHYERYGSEGFRTMGGRGFQIEFKNGYTISIMFGMGNYGDHYNDPDFDYEDSKEYLESSQAEVAIRKPNGEIMGDILGWVSPDFVAALIPVVATGDEAEMIEVIQNREHREAEDMNWGGDPKGQLATALRNARIKAKQPKKPLKIEKLDAETSDYEKLEYIHSTLQDCDGDMIMIGTSLGFVEDLREPHFNAENEKPQGRSYHFVHVPSETGRYGREGQKYDVHYFRTLEEAQEAFGKSFEIYEYRALEDIPPQEREKQTQDGKEWNDRSKKGEFFEDFWWKNEMSRYSNSDYGRLHHSTYDSSVENDERDGFFAKTILPSEPSRSEQETNRYLADDLGISEGLAELLNASRTFGMYMTQRAHPDTVKKYRQRILDGFDFHGPESKKEQKIAKMVRQNMATRGLKGPRPSYWSSSVGVLRKPELSYYYDDYYDNPIPFMGYELTDEEKKIIGKVKDAETSGQWEIGEQLDEAQMNAETFEGIPKSVSILSPLEDVRCDKYEMEVNFENEDIVIVSGEELKAIIDDGWDLDSVRSFEGAGMSLLFTRNPNRSFRAEGKREVCQDSHLDGIDFLEWSEEAEGPNCYITGLPNPEGNIEGEDNICEPCRSKWIYEDGPKGEGYYRASVYYDAEDQNKDLLKWIEDYLWDNDKKGYQAYHAHRKSLGLNAEGKKRKKISGVMSDPFDELSLDSGGIKKGIVAVVAIGLTIFGINKLRK